MPPASEEPLLAGNKGQAPPLPAGPLTCKDRAKLYGKYAAMGIGAILAVLFVLAWLLQGLMYLYATYMQGCHESALAGYNYDSDAPPEDNPSYNIIPGWSTITQRPGSVTAEAFSVYPASAAASIGGGVKGTWWRTWGPIFFTYTYEDLSSNFLIYMRQNLLRLGSSHRIARCDGKGDYVTFTEGSNWFSNRVRKVLRYTQAMTFQIYLNDTRVGFAEEAQGGTPSVTFKLNNGTVIGSAVMLPHLSQENMAHWMVHITAQPQGAPPYWVTSAATLLFAFHEIGVERRSGTPPPQALLEYQYASPAVPAPRAFLLGNGTKAAAPGAAQQAAPAAASAGGGEVEHV